MSDVKSNIVQLLENSFYKFKVEVNEYLDTL